MPGPNWRQTTRANADPERIRAAFARLVRSALVRGVTIAAIVGIGAALGFRADHAHADTLNCGPTAENCHSLQVGVNDDWATGHYQTSEVNLAHQAGLEWLRFPWSWGGTQPNGPNDWSWGFTDRIMNAARAAGEKVIFKPQGSPCWAHPSVPCTSSSTVPPDPEYLSQWQDYIRAVLQRYPDTIVAVEIWNEPNLRPFWDAPISPDRYAQLLRAGYTATKSVNPQLPVVSGGLAAVTSTDDTQMDYRSFLSATLASGADGYLDAAGIHAYPSYTSANYLDYFSGIIENVRNIVGPEMPIWVTEFGYPTPTSASEQQQATQIKSTLDLLAHTPNVPVAIVHMLFDRGGANIWGHYGMVRADYSAKPSYCEAGVWTLSFSSPSDCSIDTRALTLQKGGDGTGTVSSSPRGIACDASCTGQDTKYPTGTEVTLTANPAPDSTFAGWSGACSGMSSTCTVSMDSDKTAEAQFTKAATYTLYLNKAGGGSGTVTSSPDGINCGPSCSSQTHSYPAGTQVALTATAASGSAFVGWSNACSGTSTCTVTMNADKYVGAWMGPAKDTTAPLTTDDVPSGYQNHDITVTLTATDGGSGVDRTYYTTGQNPPDPTSSSAVYDPASKPVLHDGEMIKYFSTDKAGNAEPIRSSTMARVDTTAPDTTITLGPTGPTNDSTPTFGFDSTESGSKFECRFDAGNWAPCSSPTTTAGLPDGVHTFDVRATDQVGNTDLTPASRSFTVDTSAPNTTITGGPSARTKDATPTFTFASSEAGSTFQCRIDAGAWAACQSPHTTAVLKNGSHTFYVGAIDRAGNADITPSVSAFKVAR